MGSGKERVKGRGGGEKWGLKSTMANKSHQMTMADSHFNSEMMPLSWRAPKYWFFFPSLLLLEHRGGKKINPVETDRWWHWDQSKQPSRLTQAQHLSSALLPLLFLFLLFLVPSHRLRLIFNGGSGFISLTWKPGFPRKLHPPLVPSLCFRCHLSVMISAQLQGRATWKIIGVKLSSGCEKWWNKVRRPRRWKIHLIWVVCSLIW